MSSMQRAPRAAGLEPQRRQPNRGERREVPNFPSGYFATDDENRRYLQPAFVARKTVDPLARELGRHARPPLTTGQMRRFFNHCRQLDRRLQADGESWERVSAGFEALCSHAQYAQSAHKIPAEFMRFIDDNVRRVVSDSNPREAFLRGFLPHFEALVGFSAAHMTRAVADHRAGRTAA